MFILAMNVILPFHTYQSVCWGRRGIPTLWSDVVPFRPRQLLVRQRIGRSSSGLWSCERWMCPRSYGSISWTELNNKKRAWVFFFFFFFVGKSSEINKWFSINECIETFCTKSIQSLFVNCWKVIIISGIVYKMLEMIV